MNVGPNLKIAKAIGKIARSKKGRRQRSRICKDAWKNPETRRKRLAGMRRARREPGFWERWKATRKARNWSAVMKASYASGRKVAISYNQPKYKGRHFRSKWEVAFAKWLDSKKEPWTYESHRFTFAGIGTYIPDFYLPKKRLFVEIKGVQDETFGDKFVSFVKRYGGRKIVVLFFKDLLRLGLLTNNGSIIRRRKA